MTKSSHFVLDSCSYLSYNITLDLLLSRGALARRRSVGAGTVPPQGSHPCGRGRPTLGRSAGGPPEKNRARRGSLALPSIHHRIEPGCYSAPPSSNPDGSQLTLRAQRCWIFDTPTNSVIPDAAGDPGSHDP